MSQYKRILVKWIVAFLVPYRKQVRVVSGSNHSQPKNSLDDYYYLGEYPVLFQQTA